MIAIARKVVDIIEPIYVMEGAGVLLRRSIAYRDCYLYVRWPG